MRYKNIRKNSKCRGVNTNEWKKKIFLVNRQCLARICTARCTASYWLLTPFECRMLPKTRAPVHRCVWSTNRGDCPPTQSWIEKHNPRDIHRTAFSHDISWDMNQCIRYHERCCHSLPFLNHLITPNLSLNIDYVRLLS